MSIDEVISYVEGLGGVLTLRPQPGDGSPEVGWGDAFLYHAPDGVVPRTQPFATVVTKDHPVSRGVFLRLIGVLLDSPEHMRR